MDKSPCDVAAIDGAGHWHIFRYVTLPLFTPVILFIPIMQTEKAFREFNGPYIIRASC